MISRKQMKSKARETFRRHRFLLILVALVAVILGAENANTNFGLTATQNTDGEEQMAPANTIVDGTPALSDVIAAVQSGQEEQGKKLAAERLKEEEASDDGPRHALGRSRGVLASTMNMITSGSIYVTIFSAVNSMAHSSNAAVLIMIIGGLLFTFLVWFLLKNVYIVMSRRVFLECRCYEKVSIQRIMFLARVKRWVRASWIMLVKVIYWGLWSLTIVGAIIKRYSYFLVPYIVAENPDMKAREAITLSRRMMKGHKWECFVNELSFLLWNIAGMLTLGILDLLFVNPYQTAFYCEYYAELRRLAKERKLPGAELLNDTYLFEKAPDEVLAAAYPDVEQALHEPQENLEQRKGIRGLLSRTFGVIVYVDEKERKFEKWQERQVKLRLVRAQFERASYPDRLNHLYVPGRKSREEKNHYIRHYSVCSLIMLFFTFSFIGWLWEVSLHLIADGVFVNRGVLHGPWLPIYGAGGVLILLFLYKFRGRPLLEFGSIVILCGCVEYFTSCFLEIAHNGEKWWDYSGYFLNLDGRICAEGLLVFGLGGMAIVYIIAPILDELFQRMKVQMLVPICLVLVAGFCMDQVYSVKRPNTGSGITSIARVTETEAQELC